MTTSTEHAPSTRGGARLHWTAIASVLAALVAAWTAAGSVGLLGYPLRRTLVFVCLALVVFADPGNLKRGLARTSLLLAALAAAILMSSTGFAPVAVAAVAIVLLAVSSVRKEWHWHVVAQAVAVFAVYQLVLYSVPQFWLFADRAGGTLARLAPPHWFGKSVWVGSTFAGLDFLVLTGALVIAWARGGRGRHGAGLRDGVEGFVALLGVHLVYLCLLAFAADVQSAPGESDGWGKVLLWNVPAIAGLLHLVFVVVLLRCGSHAPTSQPAPRRASSMVAFATVALAITLPVTVIVPFGGASLEGKKIVAFYKCYGNWDRPKHGDYGRLSIGMYGMLEQFVRSLGGEFLLSDDLTDEELKDADVLILLYPFDPWDDGLRGESVAPLVGASTFAIPLTTGATVSAPVAAMIGVAADLGVNDGTSSGVRTDSAGQLRFDADTQLERIDRYVRGGGALLVFGEHTIEEEFSEGSRFNDVLESTAMHVRFDSGTFEVGGWLQSYGVLSHPSTAGIGDQQNEFGVVIGASMAVGFGADPILIGRWGWGDIGDLAAGESLMGDSKYTSGEKLGDLVVMAEQSVGDGIIVAFGDTSSITNGITMGSHVYTSRLLGYLANRPGSPHAGWRQLLGLLFAGLLIFSIIARAGPTLLAGTALLLSAGVFASTSASYHLGEVLLDGSGGGIVNLDGENINDLAYVDGTHLGRFDDESWRLTGNMGLKMTLMRSGYMALELREFSRERIKGAGLIVSIAPRRAFTVAECEMVKEFVEDGGYFILSSSYHERAGSERLAATFGFEIGRMDQFPDREPQPMGHFKAAYYQELGDDPYQWNVRLWEAWPIACAAEDAPPADWTQDPAFNQETIQRFARWLLGYAVAPALPGVTWTHPAEVFAYGTENYPVMLRRRVGKGAFVLVGDSGFPLNRNLEIEGGQPFEGMRENPNFWRNFLTRLRGEEVWVPPREKPLAPPPEVPVESGPKKKPPK